VCRLCGAPMEEAVTNRNVVIDESLSANRFRPKGIAHFIWIGLAVAVVIILGALALGATENPTLERWAQRLPFVEDSVGDAWFAWADPDEVFILELPARAVEVGGPQAIDLGVNTNTWQTSLGNTVFTFGTTDGLDFEIPDDTRDPASTVGLRLREGLDTIIVQQGGTLLSVADPATSGGRVYIDAVIDNLRLPQGPAFGSIRLTMVDGEIVFIQTTDFQRNTDAHKRMRSSLVVVADDPDTTIPTIPADAPEPGGIGGSDDS